MFFEIFGYVASSILIALVISWKLTHDIYPYGLKKFLTRLILQNWIRRNKHQILVQYDPIHAKCTNDIGVVPTEDETRVEKPVVLQNLHDSDELIFYGIDEIGNGISVQIKRCYNNWVEAYICLILNNKCYCISRSGNVRCFSEFCFGNLKLEMVEPMRSWRIWFNGVLNEESSDSSDNNFVPVHAVINLLWKALDCPFDCRKDVNVHLLADYFAKNGRFGDNFSDLTSPEVLANGYNQYGNLNGTIKIGYSGDSEPQNMLCSTFYGIRQRHLPHLSPFPVNDATENSNVIELFGFCDFNGNSFRLSGLNGGWTDGHILYASTQRNPILHVDVESKTFLASSSSLPKFFVLTDSNTSIHVEIWPKFSSLKVGSTELILFQLSFNGKHGHGFLTRKRLQDAAINEKNFLYRLLRDSSQQEVLCNKISSSDMAVVAFDSVECQNVTLVGGKGASLAKLASLAKSYLGPGYVEKFGTAPGFCVTTSLFSTALDQKVVTDIFMEKSDDLGSASKKVFHYIKSSNAEELIRPHVNAMLYKLFGSESNDERNLEQLQFAIRSSGTLEDMSDLSCAGQNETFLNVGFEMVSEKVVDCWASLFTAQSVQYRLNHGQPIWCRMGVVVQEMVDAKTAGVLFTADPRSGSPFRVLINGNFGLGESVVAGNCTPDTYTLQRSDVNDLSILEKNLGQKNVKVVPDLQNGLTKHLEMEYSIQEYCLDEETALKLGEIGLEIEKQLGTWRPIDIEWAVDQTGKVIVLQARNMTSLDTWTDNEIIHELDTALRTTFEPMTNANTGEVMPGATSPLGLSVTARFLDVSICTLLTRWNPDRLISYTSKSTAVNRQRLLLSMFSMYRTLDADVGPPLAALELTIFGHRLDTKKYHAMGKERFGVQSPLGKLRYLPRAASFVWESQREIKRITIKYNNYGPDLEHLYKMEDAAKVYAMINAKLYDLLDIGICHCLMSNVCNVSNLFALLTLASKQKVEDWDTSLYEDISKILAVGVNVESADIPNSMNELADSIASHEDKNVTTSFISSTPEIALNLLRENRGLNEALENFMQKHGHRCYAELDLMRQPWKIDPIPLIKLVQSIVDTKVKYPESSSWTTGLKYSSDEELLDSLNTEVTPGTRRFLKFVMKYCRIAVRNREITKSLLVRTLGAMKIMYNHLGSLLVRDHLLKEPKLIYFMTHYEIGLVITRDSSISRIFYKVMKRYKLYPELNKENCPELVNGKFEPIEDDDADLQLGDSISATPLSTGKVQAPVKVCLSVDEASKLLEPGDILVTKGTDIAWSPFFPMLGGVITELGGLMSHGAVVAREYGLPCVVGASNATKILKTGETVILDAGKGSVTKVVNLNGCANGIK